MKQYLKTTKWKEEREKEEKEEKEKKESNLSNLMVPGIEMSVNGSRVLISQPQHTPN